MSCSLCSICSSQEWSRLDCKLYCVYKFSFFFLVWLTPFRFDLGRALCNRKNYVNTQEVAISLFSVNFCDSIDLSSYLFFITTQL